MRILIITGGDSSERKISLMSAKQVKDALVQKGYKVKLFDLKKGYQALKKISQDFDVLFPVIHGEEGEGGELHKFLFSLKKPYVGGNWQSLKKGWYKISFKEWCDENDILTARWKKLASKGVALRGRDIDRFGYPCVLKSSNGGSSREVVILKTAADLKHNSTRTLLKAQASLLVEQYIQGVEVTVAILKDKALPVIEIRPPKDGWFDYKNKYWGKTQELPNAPSLDAKTRKLVQRIALNIHQTLRLGHYSRIDFIIARLHIGGVKLQPYVLEVNTIPGLTASSLFPKAAKAAGISFPELTDKLVKMAMV